MGGCKNCECFPDAIFLSKCCGPRYCDESSCESRDGHGGCGSCKRKSCRGCNLSPCAIPIRPLVPAPLFKEAGYRQDAKYNAWHTGCDYPKWRDYVLWCGWKGDCEKNAGDINNAAAFAKYSTSNAKAVTQDHFAKYKAAGHCYNDYLRWYDYIGWCSLRAQRVQGVDKHTIAHALLLFYKNVCSERSYKIYKAFRLFRKWLLTTPTDFCVPCVGKQSCVDCACFREYAAKHRDCGDEWKEDYKTWQCGGECCDLVELADWYKFFRCYAKKLIKPLFCHYDATVTYTLIVEVGGLPEPFISEVWAENLLYKYLKRWMSEKVYARYLAYLAWLATSPTDPYSYAQFCAFSSTFVYPGRLADNIRCFRCIFSRDDFINLFSFFQLIERQVYKREIKCATNECSDECCDSTSECGDVPRCDSSSDDCRSTCASEFNTTSS